MRSYLDNLDPIQYQAVTATDGPVVVFAGAGSGKTRIITSRIAFLLDQGVSASRILAVTFTNKAASEMKDRVVDINPKASRVLISTFHSACCRWCREFGIKLGFDSNFSIYDEKESQQALKTVISSISGVDEDQVSTLYSFIQKAKTYGMSPQDLLDSQAGYQQEFPTNGIYIYKKYQEYLVKCNAMDFGDLILNILILLRKDSEVNQILGSRYQYILVDEYQDTNKSQMELLNFLASKSKNLFVVGDDDQSIYSWRGAIASNIIDFSSMYPDARSIFMTKNYRSTACIVEAASELISNNIVRAEKKLNSDIVSSDKITWCKVLDEEEEAKSVIRTIMAEKDEYPYENVAIFYRTNSQSRLIEDELCYQGISYQLYGALRFYERAEIKDIISYLRLTVNPSDDLSFKRIINTPLRGIGATTVKKIEAIAEKQGLSLLKALEQNLDSFSNSTKAKLAVFLKLISDISYLFNSDMGITKAMDSMIGMIDYLSFLKHKYPDQYLDKVENVHELISSIGRYLSKNEDLTLSDWLKSIMLYDEDRLGSAKGVSIMTLHMAKGLEFDRVYIIGVEEGILPHKINLEGADLEEERRLMYVGMTRAKKKLSLYSATQRFRFGSYNYNDVSRFIREIPTKYLEFKTDGTGVNPIDSSESLEFYEIDSEPEYQGSKRSSESGIVSVDYSLGSDFYISRLKKKFGSNKAKKSYSDTDLDTESDIDSETYNIKGSKLERIETETESETLGKSNLETSYVYEPEGLVADSDYEVQVYEGQNVFHSVYGKGVVIEIKGPWLNKKIVVDFPKYGLRNLRLKDVSFYKR